MIVLDASVAIEIALATELGLQSLSRALDEDGRLGAPHLIDLEVIQVLRKFVLRREIPESVAELAVEDFLRLRIERTSHEHLVARIWELRDNVTAYDAAYIALAEALDAPLWTLDARLARSSGHSATIELLD